MKIGLLKCDTVSSKMMGLAGDFSDMFKVLFSDFTPGIELVVYDVTCSEYPSSLDEVDGFISTGSRYSVYDNEPWVLGLRDFVKTLHEKKKKHIGICFGHQMIAHAIGGVTVKSDRGWGVGMKKVNIIKKMPWMDPPLDEYDLNVTHMDQVEKLPPGAVHLGVNSHCPYSMFQVGDHFLSMQAHPEFDAPFVKELILYRAEKIGKEIVDEAIESMFRKPHKREIAGWILNFIKYRP